MEERRLVDEKYEFHCPQFVDFAIPQTIDDKADEFFDFDHETGQPLGIACDFEAGQDVKIPETFEEPSTEQAAVPPKVTLTADNGSQEDLSSNGPQEETRAECEEVQEAKEEEEVSVEKGDEQVTDEKQEEVVQQDKEDDGIHEEKGVEDVREETQKEDVGEEKEEEQVTAEKPEEDVQEEKEPHVEETLPEETPADAHAVSSESQQPADIDASEQSAHTEEPQHPKDKCEEMQSDAHETVADSVLADPEPASSNIVTSLDEPVARAPSNIVTSWGDEATSKPRSKSKRSLPVAKKETPVVPAVETPMQEESEPPKAENEEMESETMETAVNRVLTPSNIVTSFDKPRAPSNIVTSWGNEGTSKPKPSVNRKSTEKDKRSRPAGRRAARSLNSNEGALKRATSTDNTQRRSLRIKHRASSSPAIKRRRVSDKQVAGKDSATKQRKPNAGPPPSKPFMAKLTLPTTPICMKRSAVKPNTQFKTTEQLEMERIADFRRQLAERKKQSQASYKKVQESGQHQPKKALIAPTQPEAFTFQTDSRIKEHPMATRQDSKSFEHNLRRSNGGSPPHPAHRGPTIAKPFKFTENRKRKFEEGDPKHSPFVSMATRVTQFHNKTPQRYHTTRRSGDHDKTMGHKEDVPKPRLTCPKTPNLESRNRKRPVTAQSAADKEEQEVQDMKSYHFKAAPVNPRVMSNLNIGLKMTSHKEPTKAIGFNLESERRMKEREMKKTEEKEEEESFEFHARPMPAKMLDGPVGLAEVKSRPLTCPKSPAFALKNRVRVKEDSIIEEEENKSHVIRAKPILHVGVPFKPQIAHKRTEIQPFSFEQRNKETKARKEAKIQEIYQEEDKARQFKAKPILDNANLPEKRVKPATKQEPFNLAIEERGAKRAEEWSKKLEDELNEQRLKANQFKAKPAEVLYNKPFVPEKPNKPLTEISGFDLNTDRRATERENFEQWKLKKELGERERRHEHERLLQEEEREEVERMRREEMVHKAQPVKHYKPVQVHPSLRPLTEAQSPNFSDRFQK